MSEQTDSETAIEMARYVDTWVRVLAVMRGRTPDETRRWADPFLRDRHEMTLHQPAAYWVAPALVPAEFMATLDFESLGKLQCDLQFALDQGDNFWIFRSKRQLREAHQRVLSVLDAYRDRIPSEAASAVLRTDLPRSVALELGIRIITRHWRRATVTDPVRGLDFEHQAQVPFGMTTRLLVRGPDGSAHLWWDAFGLNLVAVASQREQSSTLIDAARVAFDLNNYRGEPVSRKAAA
jgi:hypothetical protein